MKTTMKITNRFFGLFFIACLLLACSKDGEDGAPGPQGAQGEQGPAGAQGEQGEEGEEGGQGEQGEEGEQGETGTANVIYSPWIASGFDTPIASPNGSFSIDAPEITQEVIDSGVILVYGKDDSPGTIYALPLTLHSTVTDESYYFSFEDPGTLQIGVSEINGAFLNNIFIDNEFRYILIPGGNPTSGKTGSLVDYTKMTYEEIVMLFNIKD